MKSSMDGDADYMANCFYYSVKALCWLVVDYILIDQVCMCMIEAILNCVIYSTHISSLVLLNGGNAPIIGFIRLPLSDLLRRM